MPTPKGVETAEHTEFEARTLSVSHPPNGNGTACEPLLAMVHPLLPSDAGFGALISIEVGPGDAHQTVLCVYTRHKLLDKGNQALAIFPRSFDDKHVVGAGLD